MPDTHDKPDFVSKEPSPGEHREIEFDSAPLVCTIEERMANEKIRRVTLRSDDPRFSMVSEVIRELLPETLLAHCTFDDRLDFSVGDVDRYINLEEARTWANELRTRFANPEFMQRLGGIYNRYRQTEQAYKQAKLNLTRTLRSGLADPKLPWNL